MNVRDPIEQIEWTRNLLAFCLVAAFVLMLPALLSFEIPEKNEQIITYMVGQLSGMATMALGFYFVNKVGADAADAAKSQTTDKLADAIVATARVGESATLNDPARPAGTPDDPVHTTERNEDA